MAGKQILLPRAQVARDLIPVELEKRGAQVDVVAAYRNIVPAVSAERLSQATGADWITFTSSSTVRNFMDLLGKARTSLEGIELASIGPVTSSSLRELGLRVNIAAKEFTIRGLVEAIVSAVSSERL